MVVKNQDMAKPSESASVRYREDYREYGLAHSVGPSFGT
jgi:hypothetical protein